MIYSPYIELRILLNFAHGSEVIKTYWHWKKKTNKFDPYHERVLLVVYLAKNKCILKLEILPSFLSHLEIQEIQEFLLSPIKRKRTKSKLIPVNSVDWLLIGLNVSRQIFNQ